MIFSDQVVLRLFEDTFLHFYYLRTPFCLCILSGHFSTSLLFEDAFPPLYIIRGRFYPSVLFEDTFLSLYYLGMIFCPSIISGHFSASLLLENTFLPLYYLRTLFCLSITQLPKMYLFELLNHFVSYETIENNSKLI